MAKTLKKIREEIVNSVGGGNIAGMPTKDAMPPVRLKQPILKRKPVLKYENT